MDKPHELTLRAGNNPDLLSQPVNCGRGSEAPIGDNPLRNTFEHMSNLEHLQPNNHTDSRTR